MKTIISVNGERLWSRMMDMAQFGALPGQDDILAPGRLELTVDIRHPRQQAYDATLTLADQ